MTSVANASHSTHLERCGRTLEFVGLLAALSAGSAIAASLPGAAGPDYGWVLLAVGLLGALAVLFLMLAQRWAAEWLVYASQAALLGAYLYHQQARPLPAEVSAFLLVLCCYLEFGLSHVLQRSGLRLYGRPTLVFSLLLPVLPFVQALWQGDWDRVGLALLFSTATFYGLAGYQQRWKRLGYLAAVLYNIALWLAWARIGWRLAEFPQLYLIPVGLSAILFGEVNREELGREAVNWVRAAGCSVIYLSTALPMWQFRSFGAWLTLLLLSMVGIFVGIGMRVQSFLWLGLFCFLFDVLYQLGRIGMEHALAKWAIMLALGVLLVLFVALNEKKRILLALRAVYEEVRQWD
jgi:hypothetical protein